MVWYDVNIYIKFEKLLFLVVKETMYKTFHIFIHIIQIPCHFITIIDVKKVIFPWNCPCTIMRLKNNLLNLVYPRYSPLHNLPPAPRDGPQYPAMLMLTADHDDRVVPLHTLKYVAALQHSVGRSPSQKQPLMVRVDTRSGHGAGKPTTKAIQEDADIYSFIAQVLSLSWKD